MSTAIRIYKDPMNIEQLQSLIKNGESHTIEFKKSTAQLRPAFETICAFLNVDGGFVMIGVNDKGQMIGQDITDNTRQEIAREISKIEPPAEIKIDYVSIENNKNIIVIHVEKGMHSPYTYDGRPFQRDQSVTTRMLQQRYDQLVSRRTQLNHSWESFFSENNIDTISGLGSNGTANRLKAFLLFLMALTHHVLPHLAWQRNIVRAY